MKRTVLGLLLILPSILFAQVQINKTKKQVITSKENVATSIIAETDSTLSLKASDPANNSMPATILYHFDKKGKCDSEQFITGCDNCFTKYIERVLAIKKYHWQKINENQYISDFPSKMMIEIPPDNKEHSFMIIRMDWTKQLYDLLTGN